MSFYAAICGNGRWQGFCCRRIARIKRAVRKHPKAILTRRLRAESSSNS